MGLRAEQHALLLPLSLAESWLLLPNLQRQDLLWAQAVVSSLPPPQPLGPLLQAALTLRAQRSRQRQAGWVLTLRQLAAD